MSYVLTALVFLAIGFVLARLWLAPDEPESKPELFI